MSRGVREVLRAHPALVALPERALDALSMALVPRPVPPGEVVAPDDEPLERLVLVLHGPFTMLRRGTELRAPIALAPEPGSLIGGGEGPAALRIGLVSQGAGEVAVASPGAWRRVAGDHPAFARALDDLRLASRSADRAVTALRRSAVLGRASLPELHALVHKGLVQHVAPLERPPLRGAHAGVRIVIEGQLFVRAPGGEGTLTVLGPGDLVGDLELLSGRPLSVDLVGGSHGATLLLIPERTVHTAMGGHAPLRRAILTSSYGTAAQRTAMLERISGGQQLAEVVALSGPLPQDQLGTLGTWLAHSLRRQFGDRVAVVRPGPESRPRRDDAGAVHLRIPADQSPYAAPALRRVLAQADMVLLAGGSRAWGEGADRQVQLWRDQPPPVVHGHVPTALLPLRGIPGVPAPGDARLPAEVLDHTERDAPPPHLQPAVDAWARAVSDRRIGIALGGGGALAMGHVALLERIAARGLPLDVIAAVSGGAVVAAFYAVHGLPGLERLVDVGREVSKAQQWAWLSSRGLGRLLDHELGGARLEDLSLALLPVATDADRGVQVHFSRGPVARAVRASAAFPGTFVPMTLRVAGRERRLIDGGVVNLVPDDTAVLAGARVVLASNVISTARPRQRPRRDLPSFLRRRVEALDPRLRLDDVVRSANQLLHAPVDFDTRPVDVRFRAAPAPWSPADWAQCQEILQFHQRDPEARRRIDVALDQLATAIETLRWKRVRRVATPAGASIAVTMDGSSQG